MSPVILKDAFKTVTTDQDKILAPEETVRRFREKTRELGLRILKETKRIDTGRLDIPVYFSVCGPDATAITRTTKQMGKGATVHQAEASAVMELAERFSFFSFADTTENFHTGTSTDFAPRAIPFELIARSVHDQSDELAEARVLFESLSLQWVEGYNLTRNTDTMIPFDWFFMINEFNGPSAGNCAEEAILQGLCEVVERHVSSLISREKRRVPHIDPASVTDPMVIDMLGKYKTAGIHVFLSDFTLDMGIPTVGVLAYDPATFPRKSEIVWTAGTAADPQKALSRALTETAQLAGDFETGASYVASGLPKFKNIEDADFITGPGPTLPITQLPDLSDRNIKVEIQRCVSALKEKGMEVLLVETTHPRLGVPAFYTIVPGAHFRERAAGTSVAMFCAKMVAERMPPDQAIGRLNEMDRILPGKYFIQFYLGYCRLASGDPESAITHFTLALDLNPTDQDRSSIYSYMGVALKEMERFDQALAVLEKGADLDEDRTDIYNLMGFCHFKRQEHEKAIDCFKKVISLNPGSAIDYANIGVNYRALGNMEKAVQYYMMALEIDPSIGFAREHLEELGKG
ncbi:YcaO-like family protein [Desulfosudis oleivorans]|uniref:YcaO domain-containing protein n=1 Tax=Desulfosudis oleivorans (strain DSM 6200 / JCM 39069 / Hxd3) TaxID=96561 RepID=A8ZY40_DESOH|nr:YcaO-like family protein [Desulfosudis oleivorans]ABW67047.1 protein of unknown function DUF181 [Desulfosudis oleivorans Hxd3]